MSASGRQTIRIQLMGARNAIAQLGATEGAVTAVGRAQRAQGAAGLIASERTWLHNQSLFTLRRYAYAGTLALTALIAETLKWGYQFNQTMASSRAALGPVFNDTQALNAELVSLYNFTKYTPFQFKDITIAFRQMYGAFHPLGISVDETNQTITSIVDALSYVGRTSPGALNRVAVALQHMAFMGRLTGQTVIQLARDGLPVFPALQKELGLTADELHKVGTLGIPTIDVLRALNKYIGETPGYMGAARKQAMTFSGMLTTLKDNISQLMGGLTLGGYNSGPSFIANLNKTFDLVGAQIQKNAAAGKGMSITWDQATRIFETRYPILVNFFRALNLVWVWARAVGGIFSNSVLPAVRSALVVVAPLYGALKLVGMILQILSKHGFVLRIILTALIARWLIMKQIMLLFWIRGMALNVMWSIYIFRLTVATAWTNRYTAAEVGMLIKGGLVGRMLGTQIFLIGRMSAALIFLKRLWTVLTVGMLRNSAGQIVAMTRLEKVLLRARFAFIAAGGGIRGMAAAASLLTGELWAMLVPLLANPITWIVIAIVAFGLLYWKVKFFHNAVNDVVKFLWTNRKWIELYFWPIFAPIKLGVVLIRLLINHFDDLVKILRKLNPIWSAIKMAFYFQVIAPMRMTIAVAKVLWSWFNRLIGVAQKAAHWIKRAWNSIPGHGLVSGAAHGLSAAANLVKLAGGGTVTRGGAFMVGEQGPELITLPTGSSVTPNTAGGSAIRARPNGGIQMPDLYATIITKINERVVGEAVAKVRLDAAARA